MATNTLTDNKTYLQPSGFKVIIGRRNYPNLEYFVQSAVHPGANVNSLELPGRRVTTVPLAGDKITYGELSLELILDEDMESYKEMQSWLERIVNDGNVTAKESLTSNKMPTYADITLSILSSHNNETSRIRYHDCIPTSIGSIQLSSAVSDVSYITFSCVFRFSTFEIL
jgi:hypothetical protein